MATGGTRPKVTASPTSSADVGIVALEYSGLSTVADASVVDRQAHATGNTGGAATVSSGNTAATTGDGELALGLYADSGFHANLTAGSGYTARANVSPTGDMELLAEDQTVPVGSVVSATAGTGGSTPWLMAVLVFRATATGSPTAPAAPGGVGAVAGDGSATVAWSAPNDGGSPITGYTVTPYVSGVAKPVTTVTGNPPATTATVTGLTDGTAYAFATVITTKRVLGSGASLMPRGRAGLDRDRPGADPGQRRPVRRGLPGPGGRVRRRHRPPLATLAPPGGGSGER